MPAEDLHGRAVGADRSQPGDHAFFSYSDRPGTLHARLAGNRLSVTGESDLASRAEFDAALRTLAEMPAATLVLDIADLSFFDAHSAAAVVRLAARLTAPRRLEVHCRSTQRRLLYLLGGRPLKQLSIITTRL